MDAYSTASDRSAADDPHQVKRRGKLMCNLYSMTTNVEAIRRLFQVDAANDKSGKPQYR
jgi:hypothetical protein